MLVAISQRNDKNKYGDYVDSLENSYITYFEKLGIKLLLIPNSTKEVEYYFKKFPISGVILSGGNDIDPEIYGQKNQKESSVSKKRDAVEKRLLEIAIEQKIPVLGICRGMQFINVFFNGGLLRINEAPTINSSHVAKDHEISIIEEKSRAVLGETVKVNSYHEQGLSPNELSSKLKVFAKTGDGIIEGLYHPSLPIAGIQWHPERKSPDEKVNHTLVESFIKKELFWKK